MPHIMRNLLWCHQICSSTEGQWRKPQPALNHPFLQGARHLLHLPLLMKLATHLSTSCAIPFSLSNDVLCHLSFCFALRLSELSIHMQLSKPELISCALCSSACAQMTPPSSSAYTHFLFLITKFCFITAPFFSSSQKVSFGAALSKSSWQFPAQAQSD